MECQGFLLKWEHCIKCKYLCHICLLWVNSNKFKQIPVNITIENNKLSAQFSIGDTEFGIICLTFIVSNAVYACALIGYGSAYSANLISANASNASNFKYIASEKVLTCDVTVQ